MSKRQGFTLVEGVLALIVASGMFILAIGTARGFMRPLRRDPVAWYQVIQILEQPGRYRVTRVHRHSLDLMDAKSGNHALSLGVNRKGVLRLTNEKGQGYYPLLRQVTELDWTETKMTGIVRLHLKQEGLPWQTTLVDLRGDKGS
ncbi:competence protein ComGF [Levilactobacillus humaensis]|uniref:competence protein ComGF n=1 Tax=Levilactobacillus humaensis TaxID=2950375 RepID=UPI0021C394B1|nr:competence protein ComGF [Levilactobacillus humaensis]